MGICGNMKQKKKKSNSLNSIAELNIKEDTNIFKSYSINK